MDFFLIHLLNLFFPFVKILFQNSWDVLHFYWLFYAQFCVIIFISSCLCCVLPFLSHHVRLYFVLLFWGFTVMSISSCLCCILPFLWCYICAAFYRFVVVYISYHIYAAFYRFCDVMSMLRFTILVVYLVMSMLHAFYRFLCCVLPFLWCYVYNAFYRFLWCYVYCAFYRFCGVLSMLRFTVSVVLCLCCVLPFLWCYRYPGIHCSSWTRALFFLYPGVGWPWLSSTYIDLSVPVWYN